VSFEQQRIWITGASSGIGEALARQLAAQGASLILSARRDQELTRVKNECRNPERHIAVSLDMKQPDQIVARVEEIESEFGPIDVLINCAGVSQRSTSEETTAEVEREIMEINYFGTINITKAVLKFMRKRGHGQVVTVSSVSGKIGSPGRTSYCASKHAILGYMDALRAEVKKHGIDIAVIMPGYVQSNLAINARLGDGSQFGATDRLIANGMNVEQFATRMIKAIKQKRKETVIAKGISLAGYYLHRLSPNLYHKLLPNFTG